VPYLLVAGTGIPTNDHYGYEPADGVAYLEFY